MNAKLLVWIIFIPLFLFFGLMLYIEVSTYSVLPPEQGGMSFWMELKYTWHRTIWFYALLLLTSFLLSLNCLSIAK